MAWVSTRGNARNAHAYLRTIRRRSITRFGGGTSACHITKNARASRPLRLEGAAPPRPVLRWRPAHDVAPSFARGHAERRRSGTCSQQAHPRPSPPRPLEGRVCGSCPEPGTGKRPSGYAELTSLGWTPLAWGLGATRPRSLG